MLICTPEEEKNHVFARINGEEGERTHKARSGHGGGPQQLEGELEADRS
jgi:hypothetical protein